MFNSGFLSLDGLSAKQSQMIMDSNQKNNLNSKNLTGFKKNVRSHLFSPKAEPAAYLSNVHLGSSSHMSSSKETFKLREQNKTQALLELETQKQI